MNYTLSKLLGITETKLKVLDLLIKMSKKQKGIITTQDLIAIRKAVAENTERGEVVEQMELEENTYYGNANKKSSEVGNGKSN